MPATKRGATSERLQTTLRIPLIRDIVPSTVFRRAATRHGRSQEGKERLVTLEVIPQRSAVADSAAIGPT